MSNQPDDSEADRFLSMVAPELRPGLDVLPSIEWNDAALAQMRRFDFRLLPGPKLSEQQTSVRREERFIPGPSGAPDVRVLIYRPPALPDTAHPVFFHIHGGGYMIGVPEMNDAQSRQICFEQHCVVISVDYRLAPETRYPGSLEDCYAALHWTFAQADELGIDRSRIAIGGESAGGGHAAALSILARDRGEIAVRFLLLDCPMLDDRTGGEGEPHAYAGKFIWTPASNRFGWQALLGLEPGGANVPVGAVPARTPDFTGLPATCITVGALDLFLEESLEYIRRLNRAGVPTELHVIPGAYHGYQMAGAAAPQVAQTFQLQRAALTRAFTTV